MKILSTLIAAGIFTAAASMNAQMSPEVRDAMTPDDVVEALMKGNANYVANDISESEIPTRIEKTSTGQYPMAYILSCVDSRVPPELVFDQGIGDLFVGRVAGNSENVDQLGSMEFATAVAGSKVIMVLGHSACGAIKGACDGVELGNLTELLDSLEPAVEAVQGVPADQRNSSNIDFVNDVAKTNVQMTMERILSRSPVLKELVDNGDIKIVGGFYDLNTGKVEPIQ